MFMGLLGILAWPIIDNAAHVGGLLSGGLLGLWMLRDSRISLPLKDSWTLRTIGGASELFLRGLTIFTIMKLFH
jgi:membrane associated rhomboid family serine protease